MNGEIEIHLSENWYHYYSERWFREGTYIKSIQNEKILEELKKYSEEELIHGKE